MWLGRIVDEKEAVLIVYHEGIVGALWGGIRRACGDLRSVGRVVHREFPDEVIGIIEYIDGVGSGEVIVGDVVGEEALFCYILG